MPTRLLEPCLGSLAPLVATLQIFVIGFGIDAAGACETLSLLRRQSDVNLTGDRLRQIPLQCEDIAHLSFICVRPQIPVLRRRDQLRADPNMAARAEHT